MTSHKQSSSSQKSAQEYFIRQTKQEYFQQDWTTINDNINNFLVLKQVFQVKQQVMHIQGAL